jgi:glycosyltransferase involved in cell wall biosynthesis
MEHFAWSCPKPTAWQGRYRQTREDWFAAANARNTALCLCKTDWIAYVDDLSVLHPGWLENAFASMELPDTITCGAYRKVKDLTVVNGEIVGFKPNEVDDGKGGKIDAGMDNRMKHAPNGDPIKANGNWMFGCSLVAPVKAFLEVNGWDERCDGMGSEDYCTGIALQKRGWKFRYAPRLMTYESEERHHIESSFKRSDYGVSPNDKSHAMLRFAENGTGKIPNSFGMGDIARLRERILEGQPFPMPARNQVEWYTGKPLPEL